MYREILKEEIKITKDSGYAYFIDKNHPLATGNSNRVYLHRHIASIKLSTWLTKEEHVHHIDGDKLNNASNNLEVLSASEHIKRHNKGNSNLKTVVCIKCLKSFKQKNKDSKFCSKACTIRLEGLTKEELELLIWTTAYTKLGILLGCSDKGVRKWADRLNCIMPPSRFHCRSFTKQQKLELYNNARLAQLVEH